MSLVAAMKKDGQTWMVADKQVVWDKYTRIDLANQMKIVPFQNALIGRTGLTVYGTALSYLAEEDQRMFEAPFNKKNDVVNFFVNYYAFLRKNFALGGSESNQVGRMAQAEFLVVTPDRIFEVAENLDVVEYTTYTAIGHPASMMIAAVDALSQVIDDPVEILNRAYQTCCRLSLYCGGDLELVNVKDTLNKSQNSALIGS